MPYLHVISGDTKGRRHDLTQDEVSCGRHSSNDVAVDDPEAAERHCVLRRSGGGYRLEVNPANLVQLNGQAARGAELQHGDILTIGSSELVYCADAGGPHDPVSQESPARFKPTQPTISPLARMGWMFTREGRARRQLALAHQSPDDPGRTERVAKALDRLAGGNKTLGPTAGALRTDMLLYLAWKALDAGETEKAAEYLGVLDSTDPSSDDKAALRWDLMCMLWKAGSHDAYVRQAGLYLADARTSMPGHANAVREVIRLLYEGVSPRTCAIVLDKAHKTLLEHPHVRAARALCKCQEAFDRAADIQRWTPLIRPETLAFSKAMAADAHLVAARGAETLGDWGGMLEAALRALKIAPSHRPVLYWLTRAKLHVAVANPTDHLGPTPLTGDAAWDRLAILVALHRSPNVPTATSAEPMLEGRMGHCALPELLLLGELLRRVFETAPPVSLADIEAADGVCRAVQEHLGALAWTQVPIAHKKMRVDHEFRPAYELLELGDVIGQPRARHLARVARILAGTPLRPDGEAGERALTSIERAMFQLMGPRSAHSETDAIGLLQSLYGSSHDEVFAEFPDLKPAAWVLTLALRVVTGDVRTVWPDLQVVKLAELAPEWARWLHARVCLLARDYVAPEEPVPSVFRAAPGSMAWALDCWIHNQSRRNVRDCTGANEVRAALESWASSAATTAKSVVSAILGARQSEYHACDEGRALPTIASVHPDLGELADAVCASELGVEIRYAGARRAIWADSPSTAATDLASLERDLDHLPAFVVMWWLPLVRYWLGVAYGHQRDARAFSLLQGLVDGPRADDARGQLAMLAAADRQYDRAVQWLGPASDRVPAVRYARALVLGRCGSAQDALQLLASDESTEVFAGSSYAVPAQRLAAAIAERDGRRDEGDRRHRAILESHPGDEVASIRLGRSLLERAYVQFRATRTLAASSIPDVGGRPIPDLVSAVPWWEACTLFYRLLTQPPDSLVDLAHRVQTRVQDAAACRAWRQVVAARYLQGQRPDAAFEILDADSSGGAPRWFGRSRSILGAWRGLTWLPEDRPGDGAARCLAECLRGFEALTDADSTALEWRSLAELGTIVGRGTQPVPDDRWTRLAGTHMADVSVLFDANPERRRAAADSLLGALEAEGPRWTEEQQLLLRALAAWATGDADAYVRHYGYLEPVLDQLPIRARDLWASAALIRYSNRDWRGLTGDSLPDCLADMSDPLVCLLLELADARATVGELKNPSQRLAQKIKGIQNNLAALIERLDSRRSEGRRDDEPRP